MGYKWWQRLFHNSYKTKKISKNKLRYRNSYYFVIIVNIIFTNKEDYFIITYFHVHFTSCMRYLAKVIRDWGGGGGV